MMAESIAGKTALITGAAKRIGRETALTLAAQEVNIIIHYHSSEDEARELQLELAAHHVDTWLLQADFAATQDYAAFITRAREIAGGLDFLVNNASIFPTDTLATVTFEAVMANMQVNAWTPFALGREFARQVGTGKIVNLLDSRLHGYDWTHVAYMISKHALAVFTRMAALDYAPDITVNAVAPGLILPPPGQDESYLDRLVDTVPLKRHGSAQDIADAVVFLLQSDFLTGEVINVDGGRHLQEYVGRTRPPKGK